MKNFKQGSIFKLKIKMKNTLIGFLMIFTLSTQAQEYQFPVKGNATETWVVIDQLASDLSIEGTTGSEMRIEAKGYKGLPEKAKGLRSLAAGGIENTGIGLSVVQDGNTISITGANQEANEADYVIYLPKSINLKVNYGNWQTGDLMITGMTGEVEAKAFSSDLVLVGVTGPVIAHTLSSDLVVILKSLNQESPSSLSSTSGDIEIIMPSTIKGTFEMSSVSGGIYTDHDFDLGEKDEEQRMIVGMKSTGKLNGGGVEVSVRTISGDVYIRKN
jgi:hypothetical protein